MSILNKSIFFPMFLRLLFMKFLLENKIKKLLEYWNYRKKNTKCLQLIPLNPSLTQKVHHIFIDIIKLDRSNVNKTSSIRLIRMTPSLKSYKKKNFHDVL